ncbi:Positive transcriptional regulator, MutRfamily [Streptococcus sp. HSISB1]|nr:Positive transcriptional regulator, MutRfamily [Streptococcus sp. HSISB1]
MKLEKSMQLGELYRELRIARGLKLKDVARENLSVSQLSRFENGQSMLAADKLLIAISGIHMTFSEFGHAINNYQEPMYFQLSKNLQSYITSKILMDYINCLTQKKSLRFLMFIIV